MVMGGDYDSVGWLCAAVGGTGARCERQAGHGVHASGKRGEGTWGAVFVRGLGKGWMGLLIKLGFGL